MQASIPTNGIAVVSAHATVSEIPATTAWRSTLKKSNASLSTARSQIEPAKASSAVATTGDNGRDSPSEEEQEQQRKERRVDEARDEHLLLPP